MKRLFLVLMASSLVLFACGSSEDVTTEEEGRDEIDVINESEPEDEETIDEVTFDYVSPLTGEGTDDSVRHRAIAVMINNAPQARPQSGVHQADLVYEVLAEGAVTRLLAMFHSEQPDVIGPVRSARGYYIDLANGYDSLYVTHGWSPEAQQMLERQGKADFLSGLYHDGTLFERSSERVAPHNSYISYDDMVRGLEDKGYQLERHIEPLLFYEGEPEIGGVKAEDVTVSYLDRYYVTYRYDEDEQVYHRFNGDDQSVDHETGDPVALENVLIVEMSHRIVDDVGRRSINLTSGGKGVLLQQGRAQQIDWVNEGGRILPVSDGETVPFLPGQTWINIVPDSPGIEEGVIITDFSNEEGVVESANR
ncbi:DUF3048 domain-containing protein [Desertibacillus haloalkaliphilus]|uniref:DUF3048 domain-containing protein n=1 Tax=Desertibacillus haloalkaliphilus TaxID=1328930 RepID=UPI001C260B3A|nr:DUF3048 domain-containing protein [Desertibacillus haloalkaliphilus]MBU8906398.1 DUF3048 domain-containing protein [Desertibacillus haloalkaliphilus]